MGTASETLEHALLSTKQVAQRYGVTVVTVNRWCHQGLFAGAIGGSPGVPRRIPVTALEGFVRPSELPDTTLGTGQVAARYGVTPETVRLWCHQGLLPGATGGSPGVPWQIPEAALAGFVRPEAGRGARRDGVRRCIACTIILDEEWCEWDSDGLCDACQETLLVICRRTGLGRAEALAQWMGESVEEVVA